MKKQNTTIFSRLLLASAIPFALVFGLTMLVVGNLVFDFHQKRVSENVVLYAQHATEKINDNLMYISSLLEITGKSLGESADDSTKSRESMRDTLHAFMNSNPEIYCAWFVFKPGIASASKEWYARSFLKRQDGIEEIPAVQESDLDNLAISPWHVRPYNTGVAYFDLLDHWNYNTGDGYEYTATIAYPIIRDGMIIGTVGMDILYENAFRFMRRWQIPGRRTVLLISSNGDIVSSHNQEYKGKNLSDFDFKEDELEQIRQTLHSRQSLLHEMYSPLFKEKSLVHLSHVNIQDAKLGLYLYLDSPVSKLYSDFGQLNHVIFLIFLLGVVVLVGTVVLTTNSLVKPLTRISAFAKGIADGAEAIRPEQLNFNGHGGREVTLLAESLKKMLEQMSENHRLKLIAIEAEYEKKKTEEASRARTQFFANMSHELRTPMNAIVGISDILLAENMPERQDKYVRDIKTSSEALLVIIDDILDISRLETGKLRLVDSHFNLCRMLDNVANMASYLAQKKGLDFSLEKGEGVPEFVYADEVRIRQILLNLLGNAIKFTEKGSVLLRAGVEANILCFAVIDTGIGIMPEDRAELFNAFRQVDTRKNRNVKGAGLGLSITMNLSRLMGGTIELESEYGKGSAFSVRLPLVQGDAMQAEKKDKGAEGEIDSSAAVLVVDDNAINLKVAQGVLKLFGLQCDTAISGVDALEKVRGKKYDLIFMDHMMPEMDGVETTKHIRAMGEHYATMPIVAFTANTLSGAQKIVAEAGMNDFLAKPLRKEALHAILLRWIPLGGAKGLTAIRARNTPPGDAVDLAEDIPCLNVAKGMERVGNDPDRYREMLRKVRERLAGALDKIETGTGWERPAASVGVIVEMLADIGADDLARQGEALVAAFSGEDQEMFREARNGFVREVTALYSLLRELPL